MTKEVIWTKIVLERFIEQANLSEDEEIVMRTRAAGWSRTKVNRKVDCRFSYYNLGKEEYYHVRILSALWVQ